MQCALGMLQLLLQRRRRRTRLQDHTATLRLLVTSELVTDKFY